MPEQMHVRQNSRETLSFYLVGLLLLVVLPVLNLVPAEDSWLHISNFRLNQFGKFLAFAILALGLDLISLAAPHITPSPTSAHKVTGTNLSTLKG